VSQIELLSVEGLVRRLYFCRSNFNGVAFLLFGLLFLLGFFGQADAQTAHGYRVATISSGLSRPLAAVSDSANNVYVIDGAQHVHKFAAPGYSTQSALSPNVYAPSGLAIDGSGNLYVSDISGYKVYKFPKSGSYTSETTLVSDSNSYLECIAVDSSGDLFLYKSNSGGNNIYEYTAASNYTTSLQVGGSSYSFNNPAGMAVDSSGNLFIADAGAQTIYKATAASSYASLTPVLTSLTNLSGLAFDSSDNLYFGNTAGSGVQEYFASSSYSTYTSLGVGALNTPMGMTVSSAGNLFVVDYNKSLSEVTTAALQFPATAVASTSSKSTIYFQFDTGG
jgi:DNA-binding beta-propeller fold protein YncE